MYYLRKLMQRINSSTTGIDQHSTANKGPFVPLQMQNSMNFTTAECTPKLITIESLNKIILYLKKCVEKKFSIL